MSEEAKHLMMQAADNKQMFNRKLNLNSTQTSYLGNIVQIN